jgi:tetratricopeptide (TPR) repeat protein
MRRIIYQQSLAMRLLPVVLLAGVIGEPFTINSQQAPPGRGAVPALQPPAASSSPRTVSELAGDSLYVQRRYQKAIEAYKKAPKDSAEVWKKLGISYEMLLDLKDAEHSYKESLRLNPGDAETLNNLGTVYDAMQDHSKAERQYRMALKLSPEMAAAVRNLGTNLIFQNDYAAGQELYKRALALDCTVFDGLDVPATTSTASVHQLGAINYSKAQSYAQSGRFDRAVEYLRRALGEGFTSRERIAQDGSFDKLRGSRDFEQLMSEQQGE